MSRNEPSSIAEQIYVINLSPHYEDPKTRIKNSPGNAHKQAKEALQLEFVEAMNEGTPQGILTRSKRKANIGSFALENKEEMKAPRYEFPCDDEAYDSADDSNREADEQVIDNQKVCRPYEGCGGAESCQLCQNGSPSYLQSSDSPGWRETVFAVFDFYPRDRPDSFRDDWIFFPEACKFVESHWDLICPPQHRGKILDPLKWRKIIQDTLSHNRGHFVSGKQIFGEKGYWRLAKSRKNVNNNQHYSIFEEKSEKPVQYPPSVWNSKYGDDTSALSTLADVAECIRMNP